MLLLFCSSLYLYVTKVQKEQTLCFKFLWVVVRLILAVFLHPPQSAFPHFPSCH